MTYPNLITTNEKSELEDAAELQAYRDGNGQLAEDPMHAGQPVHETLEYETGEPRYYLQVTHAGMPLWSCQCCSKLTIGPPAWGAPEKCVGCGAVDVLTPLLYEAQARCRTVESTGVAEYDGPCLIAGSDSCECDEAQQ